MLKTPIYVEMTSAQKWDPLSMTHPSLVAEEEALEAARKAVQPVPTPLMDDVEAHGVGEWDGARRAALGSLLASTSSASGAPRPRQSSRKRATKSPRKSR